MSRSAETPGGRGAEEARDRPGEFDRELDLRGIWAFAAMVGATTVVVHLIVWGMIVGYRKESVDRDPAPSPLAEANARRVPPQPRLQDEPARDMETQRAEEDSRLSTYGWVDRDAGVGRIPIDRAIDLILERGLPEVIAPAAETEAPGARDAAPSRPSRRRERRREGPP